MNENSEAGSKFNVNVGVPERVASLVAGSLLLFHAITQRKKVSAVEAVAGAYLLFRAATGHCSIYQLAKRPSLPDTAKNINIRTTVFVNRPRLEVYNFWRNLGNLPLFMRHLKSVKNLNDQRSKWKAWLPGKVGTIKWKAEIVKDEAGRLLGWNSLPGSAIDNAGKVEFRDVEGGTELRVIITYRAPLGDIGSGIARLFTPSFEQYIEEDIQSFKQYMETGMLPGSKKSKKAEGARKS